MKEQENRAVRIGKQTVKVLNHVVDFTVLVILVLLLIFAIYAIWDSKDTYLAASSQVYETYKPSEEDTASYEELVAINEDVCGWLTIYDTGVDFPLVKSDISNEEYLSTSAELKTTGSGSLFLDYRNAADFSDFNTIIFGHHMSEHAMFGDLDLFTDETFFNEHEYGNLFYAGKDHGVQFVAIIEADAYDTTLYAPGVNSEEGKQRYLDHMWDIALYTRDVEVTVEDHILVLSTCSEDLTNGRFVLIGLILDEAVENPYPEEEPDRGAGLLQSTFFQRVIKAPAWFWILLLTILILILYLLSKRKTRQQEKE